MEVRWRNPGFARVVDVLTNAYLQNGTLRATTTRLESVKARLQLVRGSYLEHKALEVTVAEVLGSATGLSLLESLAPAELQHCLHLGPSGTLLGVRPEHVREAGGKDKVSPKVLVQAVEERLKCKCLQALHWSGGHGDQGSEALQLARAAQLPQVLTQHVQALEASTTERRKKKREEAATRHKALVEGCGMLGVGLEQHRLGPLAEGERATLRDLQAQTNAMRGKALVMQYQLLNGICSEGRVQALQHLRAHLEEACKEREGEVVQTQQALHHYASLGAEFARLAKELWEIRAEAENKQWALAELGKTTALS